MQEKWSKTGVEKKLSNLGQNARESPLKKMAGEPPRSFFLGEIDVFQG